MTNKSENPREKLYKKMLHGHWVKIVSVLASVVVFITTYSLILPAITLSNQEPKCNVEEHTHVAECYDAEGNIVCGAEEHVHSLACYSDLNAAIESEEYWAAELPELTGDRNADVVAVAKSQIGYRENDENYKVVDNEQTKGYTRYGHWYGDAIDSYSEKFENGLSDYAYKDWDAMFVSFVLRYAEIYDMGFDCDAGNWAGALGEAAIYVDAANYVPQMGDLIFFTPSVGEYMRVGIVSGVNRGFFGNEIKSISVILGDSNNAVEEVKVAVSEYTEGDITFETIHGYGVLTPGYGEQEVPAEQEAAVENADAAAVAEGAAPEEMTVAGPESEAAAEAPEAEAAPVSLEENSEHLIGQNEENLETVEETSEGEVSVVLLDAGISEDGSEIVMNWNMTARLPEAMLPAGSIIRVDTSTGKTHAMTVGQVNDWAQAAGVGVDNAAYVDNDDFEVTFIGDNGLLYSWADVQNMDAAAVTSFTGIHIKALNDVALGEDGAIFFDFASKAKVADANVGQNYYVSKVSVNGVSGAETYVYTNGEAETVDQNEILRDAGLEEKPEEKTLISKKNDYTVTMTYGPEAEIPDGSKLYVKEIKQGTEEYDKYIEDAKAALGISEEDAAELLGRFFDIKIITGDGEFEPKAPVNVNIEYKKAIETEDASSVSAVHFSEDGAEAIEVETVDVSDTEDDMALVKSVEFSAESFSVYGVLYTVDFETVDGIKWSWPGEGSYSIESIMSQLNVSDTIKNVSLVRTVNAGGADNALFLEEKEDGWYLTSEVAFHDVYELKVVCGEKAYLITVSDAEISDITSLVKAVDIHAETDSSGNYVVRKGKPVTIDLTFKETSSLQFNLDQMVYPIPAGLNAVEGVKGTFTVTSQDGDETYSIDGNEYEVVDGVLVITWNKNHEYFEHLAASKNTEIKVHITASLDGTQNHIDFGGGITKDFDVQDPHGVTVQKTAFNLNKQTGEVEYLISVTSTGDNTNIVVTDSIPSTSKALSLITNTVKVYNNKDDRRDVNLVPDINVNSDTTKGFSLTIPSMMDGQTYGVAFKGQIDLSQLTRNSDGSYGIDSDTLNNATAKPEGYPEDSTTHTQGKIYAAPTVGKSAGTPSDVVDGKRTVEWTMTATSINTQDGRSSLAGGWISDSIDDTVIPGTNKTSQDLMKYSGAGIKIVITDENGGVVDTRNVTWEELGVNKQSATSWTYHVPNGGVDKTTPGTLTYKIVYTTEVDVSETISDITVKNTGDSDKGEPSTGKADVGPIGENKAGVDKKVVSVNQEDDEVTWEVAITVPAAGLTVATLEDIYPAMYEGENSPYDTLKTGSITYEGLLNGEHGVTETKTENTADPKKMLITFGYTDSNGTHTGLYGTGEQRVVKVQFTTKNSSQWNDDQTTGGRRDHVNTARFTGNQKVFTDTATAVPSLEQKVTKKAQNDGLPTGTINVNGVDLPVWTYEVVMEGIIPDAEITDTFDDRFVFVPFEVVDFGNSTSQPGVLYGGTQVGDIRSYVGHYSANEGDPLDAYVDAVASGNTVTFHINEEGIPIHSYKQGTEWVDNIYFKIIYQLRVKDEASLESLMNEAATKPNNTLDTIKNTATFGPSSDEINVKYVYSPISKELINNGEIGGTNNIGKFKIVINPTGLDLNPEGDFVTMQDEIIENLSIVYDSINISPAEGAKLDFTGNLATYTVPDNTPVTITYDALIIGNGSVHFRNEASIGDEMSYVDERKDIQSKAEGHSTNPIIKIKKHKFGDMTTPLAGAEFQLFEFVPAEGHTAEDCWKVQVPGSEPAIYGRDLRKLNAAISNGWGSWQPVKKNHGEGDVIKQETNSKGVATFRGDEQKEGWALEEEKLYGLYETKTPDGYTAEDIYWSFIISENGVPHYDYGIYHSGDSLRIANTPNPGIYIEKDITGANLTEAQKEAITFEIIDPDGNSTTLNYNQFVNGEYQITGEDFKAGNYTITERTTPPDGYDLTTSISGDGTGAQVTEVGGQIIGTVTLAINDTSKAYTVLFLNKYSSASISVIKIGEKVEYLEGAVFELFKLNTETGVEESKGQKTSDEEGTALLFDALEDGQYILREMSAPEGYIKLANDMRFTVTDGEVHWSGEATESGSVSYKPSTQTVTVLNREDTQIRVNKVWDGEDDKATPVTMKLYRTTIPFTFATKPLTDYTNKTFFSITYPVGSTIKVYYISEGESKTHEWVTDGQDTLQIPASNAIVEYYEIILPAEVENNKRLVESKPTEDNTVLFAGLDRTDAAGKLYTYWVEEEKPTGRYSVSYENNYVTHNSISKEITVTNTPVEEEGLIEVEKVWKDIDENIISDTSELPSIDVKLKAVEMSGDAIIHCYVNSSEAFSVSTYSDDSKIQLGDTVILTFGPNMGFVNEVRKGAINGDTVTATGSSGEGFAQFKVTSTDMYVLFGWLNATSATATKGESGSGTPVTPPTPVTITLNNSNKYYWSSQDHPEIQLDFENFAYKVDEESVPPGYEVSYSSNNEAGVTKGKLIVTNTKTPPPTGALKLTKSVTVNNDDPQRDSDQSLVAGDYTFTITGPAEVEEGERVTKYVRIHVNSSGEAESYKVSDSNVESDWASIQPTEETWALVPDLLAGRYTITEATPTNGTTISLINGNTSTTYATEVEVTAGDTAAEAETAQATFTNNINTGDLSIKKITSGTTSADADDEFTFTVKLTAPENVTLASTYEAEKKDSDGTAYGTPTSVTVDNSGNVTTEIKLKVGDTFTIKGLPAGTGYTVKETAATGYTSNIPADGQTGTIADSANSAVTVTATNTRDKGALKIQKTGTVNNASDATGLLNGPYKFVISGKAGTATEGIHKEFQITLTDGVAANVSTLEGGTEGVSASIADGVVTVSGLPTGTYEVSEDTTGLTEKGISIIGNNPQTLTVQAETSSLPTATFINNMDVGKLKITKVAKVGDTVASQLTDSRKSLADGIYTFNVYSSYTSPEENTPAVKADGTQVGDVTIEIRQGAAVSDAEVANLIPGTYYVKETSGTNAAVTLDSTLHTLTVVKGENAGSEAILNVTNTLPLGSLNVTKAIFVTGPNPQEGPGHFPPSGTYSYEVDIKTTIGGTTYHVQDANGTLGLEVPATPLKVTAGERAGQAGAVLSISNLPYGTYIVSELNPENVEITNFSYIVVSEGDTPSVSSGSTSVEATAGSVALRNYYMRGTSWTPEVSKLLNGKAYEDNAEGYGDYTFVLADDRVKNPGQDTIKGPGTVNHTCTATTDETGSAVFKRIEYHRGDLGGANSKDFYYKITEQRPAAAENDPYIADNVKYDTKTIYVKVTVTREGHGANEVLNVVHHYYSDANYSEELTNYNPSFDNTELGTLTVQKTVAGATSALTGNEEYPFSVKLGDKYVTGTVNGNTYTYTGLSDTDPQYKVKAGEGNKKTFVNLPAGTYVVTEGSVSQTGYEITTTYKVGGSDVTTAEASVTKGNTIPVEIVNTYRDAELTVTKTISGITEAADITAAIAGISFKIEDVTPGIEQAERTGTIEATITAADLSEGKYVKKFTSVNDGIKRGHTYKVTETVTAPTGYKLESTSYIVSEGTGDAGNVSTSTNGSLTLTNDDTAKGQIDFTNTYSKLISVEVTKAWKNAKGESAVPAGASIELSLYSGTSEEAAAQSTTVIKTVTLDGTVDQNGEAEKWKATFSNLPRYAADGITELVYIIKETEGHPGYTVKYNADGTAEYVLANGTVTNEQEKTSVEVTKAWKNADGTTPPIGASITLSLYAGATEAAAAASETVVGTVTLDGEEDLAGGAIGWKATFSNLPKYDTDGTTPLVYIVKETSGQSGYTVKYSDDGTATYVKADGTITNEQEEVQLSGSKTWIDGTGGHRPPDLEIKLYTVTGTAPNETETPVTLQTDNSTAGYYLSWTKPSTGNVWNYTITHLPKYGADGTTAIKYRVKETVPSNYVAENDGIADGTVGNDGNITGADFTNTELTEFEFTKIWAESGSSGAVAWPDDVNSITVNLTQTAKGILPELVNTVSYTVTKDDITGQDIEGSTSSKVDGNGYTYKIVNLPKYYVATDESVIEWVYAVSEVTVPGYNDPKYIKAGDEDPTGGATSVETGGTIRNELITVTLPETGGIGTRVFTVTGGMLLVFSALLLIFRKKHPVLSLVNVGQDKPRSKERGRDKKVR